jgi:VanZ family protein
LLIYAISSIPHLTTPMRWSGSDKLAHLCEYGILGILLRRAILRAGARGWILAVLIGCAVGAVDEIYQKTVPGRQSSVFDWTADLIGTSIGAFLQPILRARWAAWSRRPIETRR